MTIVYHPEFPQDIKKFEAQYREISARLGQRFRAEVDKAIEIIKATPTSGGHFLNTGSQIVKEVRRRNLKSFPFFILYGLSGDTLVFRSLIPSTSDPLIGLGNCRASNPAGNILPQTLVHAFSFARLLLNAESVFPGNCFDRAARGWGGEEI